ncbi:MAG: hypothetical protein WD276_04040 [Actinomycetota bacterium]
MAIVIAIVVFLLIPFQNGTDRIEVACGNSFAAITAVGNRDDLEIVEGFDSLKGDSSAQVSGELSDAADACQDTARTRILGMIVLLGVTVSAVLIGRRKRASQTEEARSKEDRQRLGLVIGTAIVLFPLIWVISLMLDWPE